MLDEFKKAVPNLTITIATILVAIAATWANLSARVEAQERRLQHVVYQNEFRVVITGQERIIQALDKRFDRLEFKLDRMGEK
jgi:hypothetical protein